MSELTSSTPPVKRRRYSKEFKDRIIGACEQPGASVAGIALAHGLNANLVHNWRRRAKASACTGSLTPDFLPLVLPEPEMDPSAPVVIFEMTSFKVHWPLAHIDRSIAWLHALQS